MSVSEKNYNWRIFGKVTSRNVVVSCILSAWPPQLGLKDEEIKCTILVTTIDLAI